MYKCPYCYETLTEKVAKCDHCKQVLIDPLLNLSFPSLDKKLCVYCGKKIVKEAKFCKHCRKWIDEVDYAAGDVDPKDLV